MTATDRKMNAPTPTDCKTQADDTLFFLDGVELPVKLGEIVPAGCFFVFVPIAHQAEPAPATSEQPVERFLWVYAKPPALFDAKRHAEIVRVDYWLYTFFAACHTLGSFRITSR